MKTQRMEEMDEALLEDLMVIMVDIEQDMIKHIEQSKESEVAQIEVALGVLFSRGDSQSLVLRLLQQHENIANNHGLQMSGKGRGPASTRVQVTFGRWHYQGPLDDIHFPP